MTILKSVKRGRPLALLSLVEYGTPFLRMIALSRFFPLRELGFTSALSGTNAALTLLSDFGAHRFSSLSDPSSIDLVPLRRATSWHLLDFGDELVERLNGHSRGTCP